MDAKSPNTTTPKIPHAARKPVKSVHHNIERIDDFDWLRDENWQQVMRDPSAMRSDIRDYLLAENAYIKAVMGETETLQAQLFEEMKGRIKEDDSTVPSPDGPFAYYSRYITGEQYPLFCRTARGGGDETILLDGNKLAEGLAFHQIGAVSHSPDHSLLAYATDDKGSGYYTVKIKDIERGALLLEDVLEDTSAGMVWSADGSFLFYVKMDENHRSKWVYRHKIGTAQSADVLIYEEEDPAFFVGVSQTNSRAFIQINVHDHETSEIHLIDAKHPHQEPRLVAPRKKEREYSIEHEGNRLIIHTNCEGAEDFKIMEAPAENPSRENWRDLVPHRPGTLVLGVSLYKNHMLRLERANALPRIVVTRLSDGEEHEISFTEEAYSLGLSSGYEFDTTLIRFTYSSPTTPSKVFDYDMEGRERVLRKTQEVPSGHNVDDYVTRRLMAPAHDGEQIPLTLLYHKDTKLDGSAPVLLYGYGSYGISIPAAFSTPRLSLVDRGFIHVIAHIRGGEEKGRRWYLDGKLDKKNNTFSDFISSAEFLINEGMTSHGRIVAQGGSAGGMLMGVIANRAPKLFGGIIAQVPFVDVLNTMLDDTLPLTPPEWLQWGNPIESKHYYELLASYCPYQNVAAQDYPPILVMSGITDSAVTYWEPAKWVAKLRAMKTDDNLLLLKMNMDAGHGGASGRFDSLKETALAFAFALKVCGKTEAESL